MYYYAVHTSILWHNPPGGALKIKIIADFTYFGVNIKNTYGHFFSIISPRLKKQTKIKHCYFNISLTLYKSPTGNVGSTKSSSIKKHTAHMLGLAAP